MLDRILGFPLRNPPTNKKGFLVEKTHVCSTKKVLHKIFHSCNYLKKAENHNSWLACDTNFGVAPIGWYLIYIYNKKKYIYIYVYITFHASWESWNFIFFPVEVTFVHLDPQGQAFINAWLSMKQWTKSISRKWLVVSPNIQTILNSFFFFFGGGGPKTPISWKLPHTSMSMCPLKLWSLRSLIHDP